MKCWSSNLSNSAVKRNTQKSAPPLTFTLMDRAEDRFMSV